MSSSPNRPRWARWLPSALQRCCDVAANRANASSYHQNPCDRHAKRGGRFLFCSGYSDWRTMSDADAIKEMFSAAHSAYQAADYDHAASLARQVIERSPDHAPALHLLGACEHRLTRHREAVEVIQR